MSAAYFLVKIFTTKSWLTAQSTSTRWPATRARPGGEGAAAPRPRSDTTRTPCSGRHEASASPMVGLADSEVKRRMAVRYWFGMPTPVRMRTRSMPVGCAKRSTRLRGVASEEPPLSARQADHGLLSTARLAA